MSWAHQEYKKGYDAFLAGSARHSWESAQWQHGWNDAAAYDRAKTSLRKENQRVVPARFKCLACGEIHEGMSGLPCPNMTPYSQVKP